MAIIKHNGQMTHFGCVLARSTDSNVQIMSDVYTDFSVAVVWDEETSSVQRIRVRDLDAFYSPDDKSAIICDASDEVQAKARKFLADEYCRQIIARNTRRVSALVCGAQVEVTKDHNSTRNGKILAGTKGYVINMGKGTYGPWVLVQRGMSKFLVPEHKVKVIYTIPVENGFMRKVAEKVASEAVNFTLPEIQNY